MHIRSKVRNENEEHELINLINDTRRSNGELRISCFKKGQGQYGNRFLFC